ncbi:hypothetical protein JCM17960_23740 [Magnetospira thiophila]
MIDWILIALFAGSVFALQPPDNVVVLLAEEDGSVGQVIVTTKGGSQVLDQAGLATVIDSAEQAPSAPETLDAAQIDSLFGATLAAQPPRPYHFKLFFETGTTKLDAESQGRLAEIVEAAKGRAYAKVSVIGHTDRAGDAALNANLAAKRAAEVRDLLVDAGLAATAIDARSHGEMDTWIPTADGVAEPRNRRVEINIR